MSDRSRCPHRLKTRSLSNMSRDAFPNDPEIDARAERATVPVRSDGDRDRNSDNQIVAPRDDRERQEIDGSVRAYQLRDRAYLLRESEFSTLVEIGKFRVINSRDLTQ